MMLSESKREYKMMMPSDSKRENGMMLSESKRQYKMMMMLSESKKE